MTDTDEKSKKLVGSTKKRGTGFPVLSLPMATKIIREAGTYGKIHTANALASYAGHTTANSGAWRAKAAALRDWGLVTSAPSESFALTDRALQITHPTSPEAAQKAMMEAFQHCKLYVEIFNDMAKGTDLKVSQIANTAVTTHGVAVTSKDAFASSFIESAAAVGLAKRVSADVVQLLAAPTDTDQEPGNPSMTTDVQTDEVSDPPMDQRNPQRTAPPIVSQTWPLAHGEITFTVSSIRPFDSKVFVEIGNVIDSIAKLAELAGLPEKKDEEQQLELPD